MTDHSEPTAATPDPNHPPRVATAVGPAPRPALFRFLALIVVVAALAAAVVTGVTPGAAAITDMTQRAGPFAPLVVIAGMSVLLAALVPRTVLATAAGLLFGAVTGALYVLAAAIIGAGVAFAVGRVLGRDFVMSRPRGAAVDGLLLRRGFVAVVTLRLLPVAPFGLVSYAFGATGVRVLAYLLGTLVGIAPSTILFATVGANALAPTSPAFIASTLAAAGLAVVGALTARRFARRTSQFRGSAPDASAR